MVLGGRLLLGAGGGAGVNSIPARCAASSVARPRAATRAAAAGLAVAAVLALACSALAVFAVLLREIWRACAGGLDGVGIAGGGESFTAVWTYTALPDALEISARDDGWRFDHAEAHLSRKRGSGGGGSDASSSGGLLPAPDMFMGVFTSFGEGGRRRREAVLSTWAAAPSLRAEMRKGRVAISFVLGAVPGTSLGNEEELEQGVAAEAEAERSNARARGGTPVGFLRLPEVEDRYENLPWKSRVFFTTVVDLYPSAKWIVKADDDTYIFPSRLRFALMSLFREGLREYVAARETPPEAQVSLSAKRDAAAFNASIDRALQADIDAAVSASTTEAHPANSFGGNAYYVGCLKKGYPMPAGSKWHEPNAYILGAEQNKSQYPAHAWGPIYALSAVAARGIASQTRETLEKARAMRNASALREHLAVDWRDVYGSLRHMKNEDISVGLWMLAMNVSVRDERRLCHAMLAPNSLAVYDIPKCSGLCDAAGTGPHSLAGVHERAARLGEGTPHDWEVLSSPAKGFLRYVTREHHAEDGSRSTIEEIEWQGDYRLVRLSVSVM
eukprot:PRCOL_00005750-RA